MGPERRQQHLSCQKTVRCKTQPHLTAWGPAGNHAPPGTQRCAHQRFGQHRVTWAGLGRAAAELGTWQSWGHIPVPRPDPEDCRSPGSAAAEAKQRGWTQPWPRQLGHGRRDRGSRDRDEI